VNNSLGLFLHSCRLVKSGRYVSIAAFCAVLKERYNKTRQRPPFMPPCPVKKAHFIKPSDMQRTAVHFQNRRLATAYAILAQQSDCQNCGFFYLPLGS